MQTCVIPCLLHAGRIDNLYCWVCWYKRSYTTVSVSSSNSFSFLIEIALNWSSQLKLILFNRLKVPVLLTLLQGYLWTLLSYLAGFSISRQSPKSVDFRPVAKAPLGADHKGNWVDENQYLLSKCRSHALLRNPKSPYLTPWRARASARVPNPESVWDNRHETPRKILVK